MMELMTPREIEIESLRICLKHIKAKENKTIEVVKDEKIAELGLYDMAVMLGNFTIMIYPKALIVVNKSELIANDEVLEIIANYKA